MPAEARSEDRFAYVAVIRADIAEDECAALLDLLSAEERDRAARFRLEADRVRSILSRATARRLIAEFADVAPGDLCFSTNAYGKPHVTAPARACWLSFNISHSGAYAAIAITSSVAVGIDIEQHRTEVLSQEIADMYFSRPEQLWLNSLSEIERLAGFYRLWTVKEAVLKASGQGLSLQLDEFSVPFQDAPATLRIHGSFGTYTVLELTAPPGYSAALALETDSADAKATDQFHLPACVPDHASMCFVW